MKGADRFIKLLREVLCLKAFDFCEFGDFRIDGIGLIEFLFITIIRRQSEVIMIELLMLSFESISIGFSLSKRLIIFNKRFFSIFDWRVSRDILRSL